MTIRNRKGETLSSDGTAPKRKPGRPKKTEKTVNTKGTRAPSKPVIDAPRCSEGPFHMVFPFHLQYKEHGSTKNCYFQCENHMNKHIERYKLDKRTITIGATEPRN